MKKKILITGSSGFVGNLFLKSALKNGYHVIDILRNKNTKNKDLNQLRKAYPKSYKSIFYSSFQDIEKKLKNKKINYFIHFATLYKNTHINKEIPNFINTNITFPSIILDLIIGKVEKVINFGTMMQHADGKNYISKNFYASSKTALEIILNYLVSKNKKVKFYNLKFYESFSENDKRKKLIPTLYRNYKIGKTTKVLSKKIELNILHINDIINAVYIIIKKNIVSDNYCLKYPKNIRIQKLISSINLKSKKQIKVKFLSNKNLKPPKNFLKLLPKWKPAIRIEQEIKNKFYYEANKN